MGTKKKPEKSEKVDTGGGAYVGGSVNTGGGDFVGRDNKVGGDEVHGDKITVGDVSGTGIAIGRGAQASVTSVSQGATMQDFTRLLAEIRGMLKNAGLDDDTVEVIAADVTVVEEQTAKEKPNKAIILSKLEGVAKLLTTTAAAAGAPAKLAPLAQQALEWAGRLF